MGLKVYRPEDMMTVGELMEILRGLNPESWIIVGTGLNDCEDNICRVIYEETNKKPSCVLLATKPEEPDAEDAEETP